MFYLIFLHSVCICESCAREKCWRKWKTILEIAKGNLSLSFILKWRTSLIKLFWISPNNLYQILYILIVVHHISFFVTLFRIFRCHARIIIILFYPVQNTLFSYHFYYVHAFWYNCVIPMNFFIFSIIYFLFVTVTRKIHSLFIFLFWLNTIKSFFLNFSKVELNSFTLIEWKMLKYRADDTMSFFFAFLMDYDIMVIMTRKCCLNLNINKH